MKNKKGFTLVELLAVIVILAVLVLLAVPNVLKAMDNARKSTFVSDANSVVKAFQTYIVTEQGKGNNVTCATVASLVSNGYLTKGTAAGKVVYNPTNANYTITYETASFKASDTVYPIADANVTVKSASTLSSYTCP